MAYHFIGGLKKHARAVGGVTTPTVNSYKRLIRGAPRAGASRISVYVTYGASNRTQMVRIPGLERVENRKVDGAVNPYLAAAVVLGAGMDGIEKRIVPGKRNGRNLYEVFLEELKREGIEFLPSTLSEALDALDHDPVILEALGSPYLEAKRDEWKEYHDSVSQWEIDTYLEKY